jgi:hypothetical protein
MYVAFWKGRFGLVLTPNASSRCARPFGMRGAPRRLLTDRFETEEEKSGSADSTSKQQVQERPSSSEYWARGSECF